MNYLAQTSGVAETVQVTWSLQTWIIVITLFSTQLLGIGTALRILKDMRKQQKRMTTAILTLAEGAGNGVGRKAMRELVEDSDD